MQTSEGTVIEEQRKQARQNHPHDMPTKAGRFDEGV